MIDTAVPASTSAVSTGQFADRDRLRKCVSRAGQRAGPRVVIRARWLEGEVEVDHERPGVPAKISALDGVENVPTATVRRLPARGVLERKEDPWALPDVAQGRSGPPRRQSSTCHR